MEPDKVVIIVMNSSGQFFVTQRNKDKELFPSMYGLGAGGKVDSDENPINAAKRELREELDLVSEVKELFSFDFHYGELSHKVHVFRTLFDGNPVPCNEFQWSGWMDIPKVDMLSEEEKLCPDTKILYEKFKQGLIRKDK